MPNAATGVGAARADGRGGDGPGLSAVLSKQSNRRLLLLFFDPVGLWATHLRCPHIHRSACAADVTRWIERTIAR